jgi:DNA polymerase III subunit delta'
MSLEASDAPDQEPGSPHPRDVHELVGHEAAERALADALASGRVPHAWLFTGPKGVGKATLAYRFARRLLGAVGPAHSLASDPDDPVVRRIAQGAHPDLRVATRWDPDEGKARRDMTVAAIRALTAFFEMKADGPMGRRVGIIDCADDMNSNAANALLKTLEEPPQGAVLILLSHAPGGLLPTIRSRCRRVRLGALSLADMAHVAPQADPVALALAEGAPGRAKALHALGAAALYKAVSAHLSGLPRSPLQEALGLADAAQDAARFDLLFDILEGWLARAGPAGQGLPVAEVEAGESAALARLTAGLPLNAAADAWSRIRTLRHAAEHVNLDRGAAMLEALRVIRAALPPADPAGRAA